MPHDLRRVWANRGWDTVIVQKGTYRETNFVLSSEGMTKRALRFARSGTATKPITIRSETPGAAILDGGDRPDVHAVVHLAGSYNVLAGFTITHADRAIVVYGDNNKVVSNEITSTGRNGDPNSHYGFGGAFSNVESTGTQWIGNYIHHNGRAKCGTGPGCHSDHGLYLCGDNEFVANNLLIANSSSGLQIAGYKTVSNMSVFNNVMAKNGGPGIIIWRSMDGVLIHNNIIFGDGGPSVSMYDYAGGIPGLQIRGIEITRNLINANGNNNAVAFKSNGGRGPGFTITDNKDADPRFLDVSAGDFRIAATSPAVNAGLSLTAIKSDFDGNARPQGGAWDMGAFETCDGCSKNARPVMFDAFSVSDPIPTAGDEEPLDDPTMTQPITDGQDVQPESSDANADRAEGGCSVHDARGHASNWLAAGIAALVATVRSRRRSKQNHPDRK